MCDSWNKYIYILIFKTFRILAVNITGHFIVKRQVANIIDKFLFIVKWLSNWISVFTELDLLY